MMMWSAEAELYCHEETKHAPGWVSALLLIIFLLVLAGCATPVPQDKPVSQSETEVTNLFDLTAMCDGKIRYIAERRGGEIRERVSCEWSNDWEMNDD